MEIEPLREDQTSMAVSKTHAIAEIFRTTMSLYRMLLSKTGKYRMTGPHFVKREFESFSTFESQGQTHYRCMDCGEEHHIPDAFSDECETE